MKKLIFQGLPPGLWGLRDDPKNYDTKKNSLNQLFVVRTCQIAWTLDVECWTFEEKKNIQCISCLWSEEIMVIEYSLVSFLQNFMENISVLTKCNVLFSNEHLISIWFWLKNYFEDIKSRKSSSLSKKIHKMLFSNHIVFSINRKSSVLSK